METNCLLRHNIIKDCIAMNPEKVVDVAINLWEQMAIEITSIVGEISFIHSHCLNIDTGLACANLLLRTMFGDEKLQDLSKTIEVEITEIQEERRAKKKLGAYAVITINGNAELNINAKLHRKTDQFNICFDAIDKDSLRNQHKEKIYSIVSSLSMSTSPEYHAEKISSGIYFFDENKKPLYCFTMHGGRARLIQAKPIDIEKEKEITKLIGLSNSNQHFKTPFRLFTQSLETTQDKLRSFISALSALEIFTNKGFSVYE
jgi:hypothetical protein